MQFLKSKIQSYSRQVTRKLMNFVKTGEFNLPVPEVALSYVDAKFLEIHQKNVAERLVVDEVEILFNPENQDMACLEKCLLHIGISKEKIKEFELSVGYFNYLKYTPSGLLRFMGEEFPYGVAILAPRASGENRYIILKPETENGSLLLVHEHFIIVKGVPKPYRKYNPTFMAKVVNFLFGYFIPQLGYGKVSNFDIEFDDEIFEDEDDFTNFIAAKGFAFMRWANIYIGQEYRDKVEYLLKNHEIILEDYYLEMKEKKKNKCQTLVCVSNGKFSYYEEAIKFGVDNFGFLCEHFAKVEKLKLERPFLYGLDDQVPYKYFRGEKIPKLQRPTFVGRKKNFNVQKVLNFKHGKEVIYVEDLSQELDFFYPKEEDFNVFHHENQLLFKDRPFYFEEEKLLKNLNEQKGCLTTYVNYYTDVKYKIKKRINMELTQAKLDELIKMSHKKKLCINGVKLSFKSSLAKEALIKYLLKESGSFLILKINESFAYRVVEELSEETPENVNYGRKTSFIKKDVFGLLKEIRKKTMDIDKITKFSYMSDKSHILNFRGHIISNKGLSLLCHKPRFLQIISFLGVKVRLLENSVIHFVDMDVKISLDFRQEEIIEKLKYPLNPNLEQIRNMSFNNFRRWEEYNPYLKEKQVFQKDNYLGLIHHYDDIAYLKMQEKNFKERISEEYIFYFANVIGHFVV